MILYLDPETCWEAMGQFGALLKTAIHNLIWLLLTGPNGVPFQLPGSQSTIRS